MLPDELHLGEAFAELLEPVTPDNPCGDSLEYDPAYMDLFSRLAPKEKKVINNTSGTGRLESEFEPVRWTEVERDCRQLLHRTRDLSLVMVLMRCRTQQGQAQGLVEVLTLLLALLQRYPHDLYPRIDSEGAFEPLARAAVLSALTEQDGLLCDIRQLPVTSLPGMRLDVRDVERSLASPRSDDAPLPEVVQRQLENLRDQHDSHYAMLLHAATLLHSVDALLVEQLGTDAPSLLPLLELLDKLTPRSVTLVSDEKSFEHSSAEYAFGSNEDGTARGATEKQAEGMVFSPHASLAINVPRLLLARDIPDRNYARDQMREVRLWFEEHEPSSPIPLLLRQTELVVGKRFAELVNLLPQELMDKWEGETK